MMSKFLQNEAYMENKRQEFFTLLHEYGVALFQDKSEEHYISRKRNLWDWVRGFITPPLEDKQGEACALLTGYADELQGVIEALDKIDVDMPMGSVLTIVKAAMDGAEKLQETINRDSFRVKHPLVETFRDATDEELGRMHHAEGGPHEIVSCRLAIKYVKEVLNSISSTANEREAKQFRALKRALMEMNNVLITLNINKGEYKS